MQYDGKGLDYYYKNCEIPGLPETYVAYAIGGTWATKRMPENKIAELMEVSNAHFVLLGDANDAMVGESIAARFPDRVSNMCGKISLDQSAKVLAGANKVLTHDTGLMHIAAALQKPIVAIWGNTTPDFGMGPFLPDAVKTGPVLVQAEGVSCRPCSKIGFNACPNGHFDCMQKQSATEISRLLQQM